MGIGISPDLATAMMIVSILLLWLSFDRSVKDKPWPLTALMFAAGVLLGMPAIGRMFLGY